MSSDWAQKLLDLPKSVSHSVMTDRQQRETDMTYQFKSETLQNQVECAEVAMFEGDNEIAIIDCSSNDRAMHSLIVMTIEDGAEVCIIEEFFDDLKDAVRELGIFLNDEYAGS